ncbi:LptA/OstA family protein [Stenomitos frigidus]|uniref:OstA family protein n=1 Tax=Stenomitos frigidus ULC18 TaxID=2107698 RepID=A0A2T1DYS1_9CYAN|nr:LptA/OstA family protein [Stenomitos frigidus]PSB25630.1 OstA family protein [Stenomitos frigidus ULC18]
MKSLFRSLDVSLKPLKLAAIIPSALATVLLLDSAASLLLARNPAIAQTEAGRSLTLRSDVQEANSKTGVITARGNVQINYPARQIQATSAQAQYFSRERRIVLSGNVYVLQQGNSLRGETVTYLIDEGKFVALPDAPKQVESIYLVPEATAAPAPTANSAPFTPQPQFTPAVPVLPRKQPDLAPPLSSPSSPGSR